MGDSDSFFDSLSQEEGEFCEQIMDELEGEVWAVPLLRAIRDAGGICRENKGLLFELRFGKSLSGCGLTPEYEIPGEGGSSIDFGFESDGHHWAVELMHLGQTNAVRDATRARTDENGTEFFEMHLSTSAECPKQSTEGETLKAVQRICQKCEKDGQPHKFPMPNGRLHVILVDFRTFLDGGGDKADYIHVGLGGKYLKSRFQLYWEGKLITGVFDEATPMCGAAEARKRVHFIGFVEEKRDKYGDFAVTTQFVANPYLFATKEEAREAMNSWPMQPVQIL